MKICNCGKEVTAKDTRLKSGFAKWCNDCLNEKRRLKYSLNPNKYKERQKKYNDYALEKAKKNIKEISDVYVIAELKRGTDLTSKDIRKFPELIETKRQLILNKRLCRELKI